MTSIFYLLTSRVLIFSDLHKNVHKAYTTKRRARGSRDMPKRNAVAVVYEHDVINVERGGVRVEV